jgi:uncharacterized protein (DUF1697 family)
MAAIISMLRGVNVGGHNKINMADLRVLYETLGLEEPKTFIQSGNVVFRSKERNVPKLTKRIEEAIEKKFGFHSDVILRTLPEMSEVVRRNPFEKRSGIESNKLVVTFFTTNFVSDTRQKLENVAADPEEVRVGDRELYIYFPDGQGRSKLAPVLGRILKSTGTARNWNTVTKLLEMAQELDAAD